MCYNTWDDKILGCVFRLLEERSSDSETYEWRGEDDLDLSEASWRFIEVPMYPLMDNTRNAAAKDEFQSKIASEVLKISKNRDVRITVEFEPYPGFRVQARIIIIPKKI